MLNTKLQRHSSGFSTVDRDSKFQKSLEAQSYGSVATTKQTEREVREEGRKVNYIIGKIRVTFSNRSECDWNVEKTINAKELQKTEVLVLPMTISGVLTCLN